MPPSSKPPNVGHTTASYFNAQYFRLRARRGEKRAIVAVAHSILIVVYHLLADPEAVYTDLGADYFTKRNAEQEQRERSGSSKPWGSW